MGGERAGAETTNEVVQSEDSSAEFNLGGSDGPEPGGGEAGSATIGDHRVDLGSEED